MKPNLIKKAKAIKTDGRKLTLTEIPETGELEIQKQATVKEPAKMIRFPKEPSKQYKLPPDEFANMQNAIEAYEHQDRQVKVYADSLESNVGRDFLVRQLGNFFGRQLAYFRSEAGGSLSLEEARKSVYQKNINGEEVTRLLN